MRGSGDVFADLICRCAVMRLKSRVAARSSRHRSARPHGARGARPPSHGCPTCRAFAMPTSTFTLIGCADRERQAAVSKLGSGGGLRRQRRTVPHSH